MDGPGFDHDMVKEGSKPIVLFQEFETYAVCASGCVNGENVLSCFKWKHYFKLQRQLLAPRRDEYIVDRWVSIGDRVGPASQDCGQEGWGVKIMVPNNGSRGPGVIPGDVSYTINSGGHGPSGTFRNLTRDYIDQCEMP